MITNSADDTIKGFDIPKYLGLFSKEGDPNINETAKFLQMSRKELAECLGFTADQIRPDRISTLAQSRLRELAATLEYVAGIFKGDISKTLYWVKSPNPHFGGVSPRDMVARGRQNKVNSFVMAAYSRIYAISE